MNLFSVSDTRVPLGSRYEWDAHPGPPPGPLAGGRLFLRRILPTTLTDEHWLMTRRYIWTTYMYCSYHQKTCFGQGNKKKLPNCMNVILNLDPLVM